MSIQVIESCGVKQLQTVCDVCGDEIRVAPAHAAAVLGDVMYCHNTCKKCSFKTHNPERKPSDV